jgi:hypothetical protein
VPLSRLQTEALSVLASARDPESYIAGSTPLNRTTARYSSDIDIFHDNAERIAAQAEADATTLRAAGFAVVWRRQLTFIHSASIERDGESTKLEWAADSDFRFFPTIRDPLFGYRLHPVDLAINKVFAAAGRREVRDIYDLAILHEQVAPIAALVWAGVEKSPGFTPEGLIEEIRRNLLHPRSAWEEISASEPLDALAITSQVRTELDRAAAFADRMPTEKIGLLFLDKDGKIVVPDPSRLEDYVAHAGARRGHWPSSPEIAAAMLAQLPTGS